MKWIKTADRKPPVDVPVLAYCGAHETRCIYPSSCGGDVADHSKWSHGHHLFAVVMFTGDAEDARDEWVDPVYDDWEWCDTPPTHWAEIEEPKESETPADIEIP